MKQWLKIIMLVGATSASARPLTISAPDWPPYFIFDATPDHGFGWDILAQCGAKIDPNLSIDKFPIGRMLQYLEEGRIDLNVMSFKEDRTKFLAYGKEPLFEHTHGVWVGAHVKKSITKLADLDDLSIGQLVDLRPSPEFKDYFSRRMTARGPKETIELNDSEQIFKMLASGRIDATVISNGEMIWRAKKLGLTDKLRYSQFPVKKQDYFIVMSLKSPYRKDPKVMDRLDECVREIKKTERWQEMKRRYD